MSPGVHQGIEAAPIVCRSGRHGPAPARHFLDQGGFNSDVYPLRMAP